MIQCLILYTTVLIISQAEDNSEYGEHCDTLTVLRACVALGEKGLSSIRILIFWLVSNRHYVHSCLALALFAAGKWVNIVMLVSCYIMCSVYSQMHGVYTLKERRIQ